MAINLVDERLNVVAARQMLRGSDLKPQDFTELLKLRNAVVAYLELIAERIEWLPGGR